ncbi:MAG: RNA polymerase subunit sigma-70 [Leptolyngbyaceae cyanobacterium RU_5_1]|nr:RNA polymerase subunit sigma-70 [Leptolyngbyaceae cyanobacterium RU_5_1]
MKSVSSWQWAISAPGVFVMNVQDREDVWITAGEYVLRVLTTVEAEEVERLMASNQELRTAVDFWQDRLFGMAAIAEPVELTPDLWSRIEQRIAAIKSAQSTAQPRSVNLWDIIRRTNLWQNITLWRSTSAVSVATSIVLAVLALQKSPISQTPEFTVILQTPNDKTAAWLVQGDARSNLQIIPLVKPDLKSDQALQLWTLTDAKQTPVSLGLVPSDRNIFISSDRLPTLKSGQLFAISLEPDTGSPTGLPTGPILYKGHAVDVR